jgi:hypothetical protein
MGSKKKAIYEKEVQAIHDDRGFALANFWSPKVGSNLIRILPNKNAATDPDAVFFQKFRVHWHVGPDDKRLTCRKSLGENEECPVCDYVEELKASERKEDVLLAENMRSSPRYAMNIIDVKDVGKGVQVFECSTGLFEDICAFFLDEEWGDLDDLDAGHNINVGRTGTTKKDTRYSVVPSPKPTKLKASIMEKVIDLSEFFKVPDVEKMQAVLAGDDVEEAGEKKEPSENPFADSEETDEAQPDAEEGDEKATGEEDPFAVDDDFPGLEEESAPAKATAKPAAKTAVSPKAQQLKNVRAAISKTKK